MNTYFLLHGAWHGAWCWRRLIPLLEAAGHRVIAPDLPGHGNDGMSARDVSLETCTRFVTDQLDEMDTPVILLGHSMAGAVISQVAERRPGKISCLVYLAAYLLADGQTILETARQDTGSLILSSLVYSRDRLTARLKQSAAGEVFYNDLPDADRGFAVSRLANQSLAPFSTPVRVTEENWGSVTRHYIECVRDRVISLDCQREMQSRSPCRTVTTLDTSHSPFLSAPGQLLDPLLACRA